MRLLVFLLATSVIAAIASTACSGVFGGACSKDADCNFGDRCLFPIGSCDAAGQCKSPPGGDRCNLIEELCGCSGQTVITGCGFPDGFATGPTTGASFCAADAGSE